eukprot:307398-Prymnesium_polylepis.1
MASPPGRATLDMLSAAPRMMETDLPGGKHSANTADNCIGQSAGATRGQQIATKIQGTGAL